MILIQTLMMFLIKHRNGKHIGEMYVWIHTFLTSNSLSSIGGKKIYACICVFLFYWPYWTHGTKYSGRWFEIFQVRIPNIMILVSWMSWLKYFMYFLSVSWLPPPPSTQVLTVLPFFFVFFSSLHDFSIQLRYVYVYLESIRNVYNDVSSDVMSLACKA